MSRYQLVHLYFPTHRYLTKLSSRALWFPVSLVHLVLPVVLIDLLVDAVERAAGITIFSDAVKQASKHICTTTKCEVTVRRFDDARKNANNAIGGAKR
jgi:endonuclease G, mitochondrial